MGTRYRKKTEHNIPKEVIKRKYFFKNIKSILNKILENYTFYLIFRYKETHYSIFYSL